MRAIWTLATVICIDSPVFGHSNNTKTDDSWILAVGVLFPDVASVLVNDLGFEVSLDCNPVSVAENHFWFEFYHLSPYLQQLEAGCWFAYDAAEAECAYRTNVCAPSEEPYAATGGPGGTWYQTCVETARDVRDNHCPPPPRSAGPFDHGNNPDEVE